MQNHIALGYLDRTFQGTKFLTEYEIQNKYIKSHL